MSLNQRVFSDALRDMRRAMAVFEQPFFDTARRSLLATPGLFGNSHGQSSFIRYPATDMIETPGSYELNAELPGYDKKDIKIEMPDDHTLVLSGSINKQYEEKPEDAASEGEKATSKPEESQQLVHKKEGESQVVQCSDPPHWRVQERVSGSFSRSFAFPTRVNSENIKASYDNGILKVVVPKSTDKPIKQIDID